MPSGELNENRYDTDLPRSLAQQANYEGQARYLFVRSRAQGYAIETLAPKYWS